MENSEEIDDDLLLQNFKSSIEPLTLSEQLDEWCAYYMSIGVSFDTFWDGDPCQLKYYVSTYRLKKKMQNELLWLQGMYNYDAFGTVLSNAFRSKGSKAANYTEKPYDVVEKTDREKQIEIEEQQKRVISNLNRLAQEWERTHGKDSTVRDRNNE